MSETLPPTDHGTAAQSPRDLTLTCSRPPSSLLIERPQSTSSFPDLETDVQPEQSGLNSSPASPPPHPPEPAALRPSFKTAQSSCSSLATTIEKETILCQDHQLGSQREFSEEPPKLRADPAIHVSRHHFDGPRPVGDPALSELQHFRLEYPPPSRDKYPRFEDSLFQPSSTPKSIDVEKLLESYAEEGAQLVEFLATKEHIREAKYDIVTKARQYTKSTLEGFLREQRQKAEAARAAERKMNGRLRLMRPSSPPPLTLTQVQTMHILEEDLLNKMEDVLINHGESEGTIAGLFTFKLDGASEKPPEQVRELLLTSCGIDPRLLQTRLIPSPDLGEQSYLEGLAKPMYRSYYQGSLEDIRSKNRVAFYQAFWEHWQQRSPSPSTKTKPEPRQGAKPEPPLSNTKASLIPDWFYIFQTYDILDFWSSSLTARFTQLLNTIRHLEVQRDMSKDQQPRWEKEWHEPSSLWRTPVWRRSGG